MATPLVVMEGRRAMKRKASIIVFLTLLATTALLASASSDRVRAGGIRLRPPFDGTYRTTAYFDHDEPSYWVGDDDYIWVYNGERVPSSYPSRTGEPYPYDGHDGWDWSICGHMPARQFVFPSKQPLMVVFRPTSGSTT